jgi:hypothetical protein
MLRKSLLDGTDFNGLETMMSLQGMPLPSFEPVVEVYQGSIGPPSNKSFLQCLATLCGSVYLT